MWKTINGLRKKQLFKRYYIISRKSFFKKMGSNSRNFALKAVCFLLGILISKANFLTQYYPFGAAFLAAVPQEGLVFSFLGTSLGFLLFSGAENPLKYIAICVAVAGIRWALSDLKKISLSEYFPLLNALFSVGFTGIVLIVTEGNFSTDGLVNIITESSLAAVGAYFFNVLFVSLKDENKGVFSEKRSVIGAAVSVSLFLLPFAGGTMDELSFGRCLIMLFVLLSAYVFGESAGAIAGICACLVLISGSDEAGYAALSYAVAGISAGIFSSFGKAASAISFVTVNAVSAILLSGRSYLAVMIGEAALAGIVFLLVPSSFLNALSSNPSRNSNYNNSFEKYDTVKRMAAAKLKYASSAFGDIGGYIEQVYNRMEKNGSLKESNFASQTKKEVCGNCSSRSLCNIKYDDDYNNAFLKAEEVFKSGCEISDEKIPDFFNKKCKKGPAVINSLNREYLNSISREEIKRRSSEIRMSVAGQFEETGRLLYDLSEEISAFADYDADLSKRIEEGMKKRGITAQEVICRKNGENALTVEIFFCKSNTIDTIKGYITGFKYKEKNIVSIEVKKIIEEATKREFEPPFEYPEKGGLMIRTTTKTDYTLDFGIAQHSRKNGKFCGDSYEFFYDGSGKAMLLISDGMGTGGRAAVDSTMTTAVFTRLVKAGIGFDNALNAVNSALMVKSDDESLATIDAVSINLFNGKTEFLKAGASFGFIERKGVIRRIECNSLPVGILKNIDFEKYEMTLKSGDIIILISDGAATFSELIEKKIKGFKKGNAQDLAEEIMEGILNVINKEQEDDITVLIGILKDNISKKANIQKTA